ncbi:DUF6067 family protein [Niabella terrae]
MAHVLLPWRRPDAHVDQKRVVVIDGQTGKRVLNCSVTEINREQAHIFFEPVSGRGTYYVYYLLYKNEGRSNYPKGVYLRPDTTAAPDWIRTLNTSAPVNARVTAFEVIDSFNSFYPMEVIATQAERRELEKQFADAGFIVFPEDRSRPIIMKADLPQRWMYQRSGFFEGNASKGEFYTFQLGVYALKDLTDVEVQFSDLVLGEKIISADAISCINTEGITYDGKSFHQRLKVPAGNVQALWCSLRIPETATTGDYTGTATVRAKGQRPVTVSVKLRVDNRRLQDGGISHPELQTRLHWLNSTMAQKNEVIAPYTPLKVDGNNIKLLGRKLILADGGFPSQVQTFFTQEMTGYTEQPKDLLTEPIHFHVSAAIDGKDLSWQQGRPEFIRQEPGTVQWKAINQSESLRMEVLGTLEFDGFMHYNVMLTALQDIAIQDIRMHIPFQPAAATYMMGLGAKGGIRPDTVHWKWDVAHKNQDGAWIGAVNGGMQFSLRDEKYVRPLNTNFYLQKPLLLPASWGNDHKGGIDIFQKGTAILVNSYSGSREMKKGDTLYYNFNLLITPFHPIDTDFQWANRFYHKYDRPETIRKTGATLVNIHHATPINPWINYPFIEYKKMKAYIDSAHSLGLKVKIYNTVRELSNRAYETFPLRSLGHEVYSPGPGGGFSWLQEHLGNDYIAAWFVPGIKDAAIVNSGMNRWHNYYVEGMNWLVEHVGIDGIYLDDVAFDRVTMKRIKRVLTRNGHPGIIDLHSANQYNERDGFNNSANLYMEHFPYLNRLWFGEYFDYEKNGPDFFLTEVSGIPFGLMGEMLQDGGNAWRGMIYGMTNRMPWSDNADPRPLWKAWDTFGIQGAEMIGYWSSRCPVTTSDPGVLATVYKKKAKTMVALASWAPGVTDIELKIDWKALGIDPAQAKITAPAIRNFQEARIFQPGERIPVLPGKGWLLEIE